MNTCFGCQASIPEQHEYCSNCGRIVGEPRAKLAQARPKVPYQRPKMPTKAPRVSTKAPRPIWFITLALLAGIVALVAVINLQRRTVVERSTRTTPPSQSDWSRPQETKGIS